MINSTTKIIEQETNDEINAESNLVLVNRFDLNLKYIMLLICTFIILCTFIYIIKVRKLQNNKRGEYYV